MPPASGNYTIAVNELTGAGDGKTLTLANDINSNTTGTITVSSTSSDTLAFSSSFQLGNSTTTINLNGANVVLNGINNDNNGYDNLYVASSTGNTLTINGQIYTEGNGNGNRNVTVQVNSGVLILNTTVAEKGSTNAGLNINLSGGTLDLQDNPGITGPDGSAGYVTLSSGTLNNISGSALTLSGNPGVNLNGSFTFGTTASTGTNNLNLGTGIVTLSASPTITLLGSGTLTLAGAMQSTTNGFTEAGTGTLALSGSNLYTGATTITGGRLLLNNAFAAQDSIVTISAGTGATGANNGLQFNAGLGDAFTIGGLSGASNEALLDTSGSAVALTVGNNNNTATYSGILSGGGSLIKTGTGTQTLTGVNTFTGATTINAGTLTIGAAGDLNSGSYAANISDSGTFNYNSSMAQTLSGTISGLGALIDSGAGTLTLTSSNSYSGGTTLSGGTLDFANNSLGSAGAITVNGGTLQWASGNTQDISSRLTLVNGGSATLDTQGNNVTLATGFGGNTSSSLTKIGSGTLTLSGANTYSGGTTISAGTLDFDQRFARAWEYHGNGGTIQWASGNTQRIFPPAATSSSADGTVRWTPRRTM